MDELLPRLVGMGIQLAVVSSNTRANVQRVLGPANAALISYYECGVALLGKTGRFRKILKRSKVHAHEALCIGDELRDLEAARKAHIPFGAVTWGYNLAEAMRAHSPRAVFTTVGEIESEVAGG
jgi:phosphoglycolate phosphatase